MAAAGLWLGGLLVLGVIVAPLVFRNVPAPYAADAMTLVFRRFDRFAVSFGIVILLCEALLARAANSTTASPPSMVPRLRVALGVAGAALATLQATVFSVRISELHERGAIRGFGEDGALLERFHRYAESAAKLESACVLGVLVLFALALRTGPTAQRQSPRAPSANAGDGAPDSDTDRRV
jgi:uncharacterized membrane protein